MSLSNISYLLRQTRLDAIEECINAVNGELVLPENDADVAFNDGIYSAVTAIRALIEKE